MSGESLRETAVHGWHVAAGAKMVDFAGWSMPLEYPSGTVTEHRAVRSGCGAFDVSHMGTLLVSGAEAVDALDRLLTNDLSGLAVGAVQYTLLCDDRGGVVDDLLATRLSVDQVLLVPNAANTAAVLTAVRTTVGAESVADHSADTAIFAVQGPSSPRVLDRIGLPSGHAYMTVQAGDFRGAPVTVSRSGYTGEHGYELLVANPQAAVELWEEICAPGVTPSGLGARDTLRTEMGYPLHGQDLGPAISPVAAMLGWAVAWDKPVFAGRDALVAERSADGGRRLRGLLVTDRGIPRPDMPVLADGTAAGVVTSGTFSPTLRQGIALALLDRAVTPGRQVAIEVRGRQLAAEVVKPPFVAASPK